jgi:uncharacterized RDD family membrane protein YckC
LSTSPQSAVYEDDSTSTPAWKQEVNARLVAHRTRRTRNLDNQPALPGLESAALRSEAVSVARVAARVAERYSRVPSYSEMLAAEAANAARAAEGAAKAAQEAHDAAQAATEDLWSGFDTPNAEPEIAPQAPAERAPERIQYRIHPGSLPEPRISPPPQARPEPARPRTAEIVDPFEDCVISPAQPLPVRILEFPRELVAARKARPRHAEGPLRDESPAPEKSQLRIFEVESEAISHEPDSPLPIVAQVLPEWHSIRLDAQPVPRESAMSAPVPVRSTLRCGAKDLEANTGHGQSPQASRSVGEPQGGRQSDPDNSDQSDSRLPQSPLSQSPLLDLLTLHVASIEDRLMAGIVDAALILIAFLLFVLVFVASTTHPPVGKPALVYSGIAIVSIFLLYQALFFTWSDCTPGMRYARIALCTFDDENPTRKALHWRIAALFLSAMPLGLGFLWALFDDDHLGWHDRISKTYQRSYR